MTFAEILDKIEDAEMILVGLGEEFNDISLLKDRKHYQKGRNIIEESEQLWLMPAYDEWYRSKNKERTAEIQDALQKLADVLKGKNYFVVSVSVNEVVNDIPWREGRLVSPCGGNRKKQCSNGCEGSLDDVSEEDKNVLEKYFSEITEEAERCNTDCNLNYNKDCLVGKQKINLRVCPQCGNPLILNNIYAERYDENGYLPQWQLYTKWLQGTLNKKIVILELGVGMKFPSVIRWPFEKVAFFNQKAEFFRVNGNLYQLSEELKEKGVSIAKNAIDWLRGM